jgi:hypothetical protein
MTMSGLPGRDLTCKRKRKPCSDRKERKNVSGLVFTPRMRAMRLLRLVLEKVSVIGASNSTPVFADVYEGGDVLRCRPHTFNDVVLYRGGKTQVIVVQGCGAPLLSSTI